MSYARCRQWVFWGAAYVLVGGWGFQAVAEERPFLFSVGRLPATWLGQPWSYDDQVWNHMQVIGATMSGANMVWVAGQPNPPPADYDWDAIAYADHEIAGMVARGIEPTLFLGLTPAWAALHPELPPHRTPPAEEYVEEFMAYHRFVANRYKDDVQYYYFWNEPNGCSWINDDCANMDGYPLYTRWLIRCSQAVKEMDPDAKIIAGRLDYNAGVTTGYTYVQGMYDEGAGPWVDGIAIHPYDWSGTIHWQAIIDTRNVMVANGDADKPIWLAEYGWNGSQEATAEKLVQVLTELKKPQWEYVKMANYLVLNAGNEVIDYALMNVDLTPRPGYYAFRDFDKTFPPTAAFSADVQQGDSPLTVTFLNESSYTNPVTWEWDFGDGQTSDLANPTHEYPLRGLYTVTLTVTDKFATDIETKTDYIEVFGPPGDMDGDWDVDQTDFGALQACLTGEGAPQQDPACRLALLDGDDDVSQGDVVVFLRCLSGAGIRAELNCAD